MSSQAERILQLLIATTQQEYDKGHRQRAESDLERMSESSGYCSSLLMIAGQGNVALPYRRLALVMFKNTAKKRWDKVYPDEKMQCRQQLWQLTIDPSLRVLASAALAVAVSRDSAQDWELFSEAAKSLLTQSPDAAIELLFACSETCDAPQLVSLIPVLMSLLQQFVNNPQQYPQQVTGCFRTLNAMLSSAAGHESMMACISALFPHLVVILSSSFTGNPAPYTQEAAPLCRNMLVYDSNRQQLDQHVTSQFISDMLSSLQEDLPTYERVVSAPAVRDGDESNLVRVLANKLDLFRLLLEEERFHRVIVAVLEQHLNPLAAMLVRYALLQQEQIVEYESDHEEFLKAEGARKGGESGEARDAAMECSRASAKLFGPPFIHALLQASNATLQVPLSTDSWRSREAVLVTLHFILLMKSKKAFEQSGVGCTDLCQMLINTDLTSDAPVLLSARALLLLQTVMLNKKLVPPSDRPQLAASLLPPAILTLGSPNRILASCSCQLLSTLVTVAEQAHIDQLAEGCLGAINALLRNPQLVGEPLYLVFDLATKWLKRTTVQCQASADAPRALVFCWKREDSNLAGLVLDLVKAFVPRPECEAALIEYVQSMTSILQGTMETAASWSIPSVLQQATHLIHKGSENVCRTVCERLVAPLCQLILGCSDESTAIIADGSVCLGAMLRRLGGETIAGANIMLLPSAMRYPPGLPDTNEQLVPIGLPRAICAVASSVLSEHRKETALMNIGPFLVTVVNTAGHYFSQDETREFVRAVGQRACSCRADSAIEGLIHTLAEITLLQPSWTMNVLGDMTTPVFSKWLNHQPQFMSTQPLLRTAQALVMLLENHEDMIRNIQVAIKPIEAKRARARPMTLAQGIFVTLARTIASVMDHKSEYDTDAPDGDEYGFTDDDDEDDDDGSDSEQGDGDESDMFDRLSTRTGGSANGGTVSPGTTDIGDAEGWEEMTPFARIMAVLKRIGPFVQNYHDAAAPFLTDRQKRQLRAAFEQ